jgi:hypothetical protein
MYNRLIELINAAVPCGKGAINLAPRKLKPTCLPANAISNSIRSAPRCASTQRNTHGAATQPTPKALKIRLRQDFEPRTERLTDVHVFSSQLKVTLVEARLHTRKAFFEIICLPCQIQGKLCRYLCQWGMRRKGLLRRLTCRQVTNIAHNGKARQITLLRFVLVGFLMLRASPDRNLCGVLKKGGTGKIAA